MSEQHNAYIANEWKAQDDRLKTEMPDPVPMRWVVYLAVDPAHRGQGYGRALLEDAKRKSIADGGSTVGLQVDMGEGPGESGGSPPLRFVACPCSLPGAKREDRAHCLSLR